MSVHLQDHGTWYAACALCGVCSPPLRTRLLAVIAESAHVEVCSQRQAAA